METPELVVLMGVLVLASFIGLLFTSRSLWRLKRRYRGIINVNHERDRVVAEKDALVAEITRRRAAWETDFGEALRELEELSRELDTARDRASLQLFGIYEPHYDFETSAGFKAKLDEIRGRQKSMIRDKTAATCRTEWVVGSSKTEGRRMTERYLKLLLRSFNGECDAAVVKVRYNNVIAMEGRITRAVEALNKLGETQHCSIVPKYLDLKISELRLAHEFMEKREAEKDEQRRIREQMREEERVRREIEKATTDAEKEERQYEAALEQARRELREADDQKRGELEKKIAKLQGRLDDAHEAKERAVSRAQLTKSGHVYVVSNIGSFGENVYKIGLTRRLDPEDRIRELGDASVPFPFDVHAMIFSENAPDLEQTLHRAFNDVRVNLVNARKEFFAVSLAEIEKASQGHGSIEFTLAAEAEQYRKTLALRDARESPADEIAPETQVASDARAKFEQRRNAGGGWQST